MTHGGRTIVLAQLFLTVILQAIFTGNLNNILLKQPFQTQVDTFQDYTNPSAPKFKATNSICYPVTDLVAKNYLDLEAGLHQDIAVNIVTAPVSFAWLCKRNIRLVWIYENLSYVPTYFLKDCVAELFRTSSNV